MISLYRIGAVTFRHLMTMKRLSWFIEIGYWTILDIIIFGSLGKATTMMNMSADPAIIQALVTNAVFWYLVLRTSISIGFTLLTELFDMNLIAIFATPLRILEWITSSVIVGGIAGLINFALGWLLALIVFGCNIWSLGLTTLALMGSLLISGWTMGLILMCVLLFVGKKGTGLAFAICWSLVPFSCVYYPIEVFPLFLQKFVLWIPMAHAFTALRSAIMTGTNPWDHIVTSLWLNVGYFAVACVLFAVMFKRSKKRGLARLELEW